MGYQETPKEKEKRLAYYAKNKADADDKEAKANAEIKRKFDETTNTDTSKNTNPMGDTYKKGGKIMSKKAKRYDDGGEVETESTQGQNKNIGDDVRARAMAALASGISDTPTSSPSKSKSFARKAKDSGFTSADTGGGAALMTRKDRRGSTPMYKSGGSVGSASRRADGIATKGKTRGKIC